MRLSPRIIPRLLIAAALAAEPAAGARAATITVQVNATVVKPLLLAARQDLEFGTILLSPAAGTRIVSISSAGILSCGTGLICTGATRHAIFNVSGTKSRLVRVNAAPSNLVNAANGATIQFTPIAPANLTLTNSGAPGTNFGVGGSIALTSTTSDGLYSGTVEVTVDYQ